jgi:hypothetical protein
MGPFAPIIVVGCLESVGPCSDMVRVSGHHLCCGYVLETNYSLCDVVIYEEVFQTNVLVVFARQCALRIRDGT